MTAKLGRIITPKPNPNESKKSSPTGSEKSSLTGERVRRTSSIPEESVSSLPKSKLKIILFPKTDQKIHELIVSRRSELEKGIHEKKDVINKTAKQKALGVIYTALKEDETLCLCSEAELLQLLQEKLGDIKLATASLKSLRKGLTSETSKTLSKIYKISTYKKILLCDLSSHRGREKIKEITDNYSDFFKTTEDYAECLHFLCEEFSEDKVLGTFLLDKLIQINPFKEVMMKEYSTPSFSRVRDYLGEKFNYSAETGKIQISTLNGPRFIWKEKVEFNFITEIFNSKSLNTDAIKDYSGLCDDIKKELNLNTCLLIYKNQLLKCKNDLDKMKLLINFKEVFSKITDYNIISDEVEILKKRVLNNIFSPHIRGSLGFNEITSHFMSFLNENYSEFSKENTKSRFFSLPQKHKKVPEEEIKNCLIQSQNLIQLLQKKNLSKEMKKDIANKAYQIASEGIDYIESLLDDGSPLTSELESREKELLKIIEKAYSYINPKINYSF